VEAGEAAAPAHEAAQRAAVARDVAVRDGEDDGVRAAQAGGGELVGGDLAGVDARDTLDRGLRGRDGLVHEPARLADHQHPLRRRRGRRREGEEERCDQCRLDEHMGSRP
jgi:hypothetical protein